MFKISNRYQLLVHHIAITFLFFMNMSIIVLQNNQMRLLNSNRITLPFNQIGERVPQLFWSTQDVGIRTSIFWKTGRYQSFSNAESHSCRSSFWHDVDRSLVTGRIIWLSESQGSVNQIKKFEVDDHLLQLQDILKGIVANNLRISKVNIYLTLFINYTHNRNNGLQSW